MSDKDWPSRTHVNKFLADHTSQCSKKGNILQILLLARFEPMTNSRRQESCAYNHLATKLIMIYEF